MPLNVSSFQLSSCYIHIRIHVQNASHSIKLELNANTYINIYRVYIVFIDRASARATQRGDRKRFRDCEMCLDRKCVKERKRTVQVNHNSNT